MTVRVGSRSARRWQRRGIRRVVVVLVVGALAWSTPVGPARSTASTDRPNVLIVLVDDQPVSTFTRALMPNVYGQIVDRGVKFSRGYVASSLCCPSRAELLTGLYENHTGVDRNKVPLTRPTITEALHDAGYRTMLAGKYLNSWPCTPRPEWDQWVCAGEGPTGYSQTNPTLEVNGEWQSFTGYQTDVLASLVEDFIASTPASQPFFALYAPTSPHIPADDPRHDALPVDLTHPPSYDEDVNATGKPAWVRRPPLDATAKQNMDLLRTAMTRAVPSIDDAVGSMLSSLGDRADNTIVVYMSDNGYLYGEHRLGGKGVPYEESARVPFAIRYPTVRPTAAESDALVSNVDLAPTIAEAAGIEWHADGISLLPLLSSSVETVRQTLLLAGCEGASYPCPAFLDPENFGLSPPSWWGVVTPKYKYIEYNTGERELYDLQVDPYEITNVAAANPSQVASLSAEIGLLKRAPLDTTIATGPAGPLTSRSAKFTFFSPWRQSAYRCRLTKDGVAGAWTDCNSGSYEVAPLADGDYAFEVAGTDETNAVDPTPASRAFSVHATGPSIEMVSPAVVRQAATDATLTWSSPDAVAFECRVTPPTGAATWDGCPDPPVFRSLAEGTSVIEVRGLDGSGAVTTPPAMVLVTVDTTAPTFAVRSGPVARTRARSATFTLAPNETIAGPVTCQIDDVAPSDCTAGTVSNAGPLPEGPHTLAVTASDDLGNTGTWTYSWTIDLTPPVVTITPSSGYVASSAVSISATSSEPPALFYCQVDAGAFYVCPSAWVAYGLVDGIHRITVLAFDAAGNGGGSFVTLNVDTVAPSVTVSGPVGLTSSRSATLTMSSNEPGTFECSIDGAASAACASPFSLSNLADGSHQVVVRAVDRAGNRSADAAVSWTVDATPPTTTIAGPAASTNSTTATFTLTASEPNIAFVCAVDGAPVAACSSSVNYTGLAAGKHAFVALAIDAAGNVGPAASSLWTVDLTAPTVTITSKPPARTTSRSATFGFTSDDTPAKFVCALDGGAVTACTSGVTYSNLGTGRHSFVVVAYDPATNRSAPATALWSVS